MKKIFQAGQALRHFCIKISYNLPSLAIFTDGLFVALLVGTEVCTCQAIMIPKSWISNVILMRMILPFVNSTPLGVERFYCLSAHVRLFFTLELFDFVSLRSGCVFLQRMALLVPLAFPTFLGVPNGVKLFNFVGENFVIFPLVTCTLYLEFFLNRIAALLSFEHIWTEMTTLLTKSS